MIINMVSSKHSHYFRYCSLLLFLQCLSCICLCSATRAATWYEIEGVDHFSAAGVNPRGRQPSYESTYGCRNRECGCDDDCDCDCDCDCDSDSANPDMPPPLIPHPMPVSSSCEEDGSCCKYGYEEQGVGYMVGGARRADGNNISKGRGMVGGRRSSAGGTDGKKTSTYSSRMGQHARLWRKQHPQSYPVVYNVAANGIYDPKSDGV